MRTISILSIIGIVLLGMSAAALCADIYLEQWEGGTTAGWQAANSSSSVICRTSGGNPDGHLEITGDSNRSIRIGSFITLPAATGDFWAKGVGMVKFDVSCENTTIERAMLMIHYRDGESGTWLYQFSVPNSPEGCWSTAAINLHPDWDDAAARNAGWIKGQGAPSFHETMAQVYSIDLVFTAAQTVNVKIDNFRLTPGASCMQDLPDPVLVFKGKGRAFGFEREWKFGVENWDDFPTELFLKSPELPRCGIHSAAARTYVYFKLSNGAIIAEKCIVTEPSQLQDLGFVFDLEEPTQIYLELYDRKCNLVYRSNKVTAQFSVNRPPIAKAGEDMVVECSGATTPITVDGSASEDPDGDQITFEWYAKGVTFDDPSATVTVGHFPTGIHLLVLKVSDGTVTRTDVAEITVVDSKAPKLTVTLDRTILWPPNHKYVDVTASIVAEDCDPSARWFLMSISSDGENAGTVSGAMQPVKNAEFGTADTEFQLLAERNGNEKGRTYEIIFSAWDSMFHVTYDTVYAYVPHDQRDHSARQLVSNELPTRASLDSAYPNPFNPTVNLAYSLPVAGRVQLAVYDVSGRLVRRLQSSHKPAGTYETNWNALDDEERPVPSGVYFVRFQCNNERITRKIVLMK